MFTMLWWEQVGVWSAVYAATMTLIALVLFARELHARRRI